MEFITGKKEEPEEISYGKKKKNFDGSMSVDEFIKKFKLTPEQIKTLYLLRAEGKLY